jgi:hypothetical protein
MAEIIPFPGRDDDAERSLGRIFGHDVEKRRLTLMQDTETPNAKQGGRLVRLLGAPDPADADVLPTAH